MSAIDRLNRRGGAFVSDLREAAIQNPAAALLIGAGAAWLLASRTPIGTMAASGGARLASVAGGAQRAAADATRASWETASGAAAGLGDRVADLSGRIRDSAAAAGASVSNMASGAAHTVAQPTPDYEQQEHSTSGRHTPATMGDALGDQAASLRHGLDEGLHSGADRLASARAHLTDLFENQPLALGVFGMALGAALAGALPATDFENELLGETSHLRKKVMRQADHAREMASTMAEKAVEEAKAQNLTPESLREDVAAAAAKAGGVAKTAAEALRQTAQEPRSQGNTPNRGAPNRGERF
jgi:hypothetical protein